MTHQTAEERAGIAAAIVVREGRVLMVRRRVSEGQLSWQFPAGETEAGESPKPAAGRETAEETGLGVTAVKHGAVGCRSVAGLLDRGDEDGGQASPAEFAAGGGLGEELAG